ncbi:Co2+/Mg2+ efflux protein ApaG [Shewanella surugensis]|uniref:Protein ApaG n=1 Tax=Shewanella surugensis TaxID=212020 RepID=A0ABT0LHN7_9GAMM|nr:Co2+/Mg2+ efflux protein ApaG [Shewanella surugensis]MCL1126865.1 Co2+/Mg2+ efflux protein ApaG [Shewanella surugensis]
MTTQSSSINIEVTTKYIEEQSSPEEEKFLFSYTVKITNLGNKDVTLKSRYWHITDGDGQHHEVHGDGVIGKTPTIKPKAAYQYTSGTMLKTPMGFMTGHYNMLTHDEGEFKAIIPIFRLAIPGLIH